MELAAVRLRGQVAGAQKHLQHWRRELLLRVGVFGRAGAGAMVQTLAW